MSVTGDFDEADCLCQGFVPEDKRIDFMNVLPDKKTGKPRLQTWMRYHQECPIHGLNLRMGPSKPYDKTNPNAQRNVAKTGGGAPCPEA